MACYRLGFLHLRGHNASRGKDLVQAYLWFSLAAQRELGDADHWRDTIAETLSEKELSEARALLAEWELEHESGAAAP
jgi:TPR repeat protein